MWTCSKLTETLERIIINDADMASVVYDHATLSAAADVRRPAATSAAAFYFAPVALDFIQDAALSALH